MTLSQPDLENGSESTAALPRRSVYVAAILLSLILGTSIIFLGFSRSERIDQVTPRSTQTLISLNHAQEAELQLLPRIGPTTAYRIVTYRDAVQPFTSIEQLMEVQRVGPVTLDAVQPWVRID